MYLRELELEEFRSLRKAHLHFAPAGFRLIGPNGSGKSTLLEAIALLSTTRSPRTASEREIPNWQSGAELAVPPYARVRGTFDRIDGSHTLDIGISGDERGSGATRKRLRLDDRPIRAIDAVGQLKTVLFSPEDVDLISGAPAERRRYLDMTISQASRAYLQSLSRYNRVLEQRNSLLRSFVRERHGVSPARISEELTFWDNELTATGADVLALRLGALRELGDRAAVHFATLSGEEGLTISYLSRGDVAEHDYENSDAWHQPTVRLRQRMSASLAAGLRKARGEELKRGSTIIGPHRDDVILAAGGVDLGKFGSRGQQRVAMVALKLAELDFLTEAAGESPILLLDDVLSELDSRHRENVVRTMTERRAQVCVTATDATDLERDELGHLPELVITSGRITSSPAVG